MEHKRDIGELLQKKLEEGQSPPNHSLWNRLDASLNAQARRRRRAAWFWSGGVGIVAIALLTLLVNKTSTTIEKNDINTNISTPQTNVELVTPDSNFNNTTKTSTTQIKPNSQVNSVTTTTPTSIKNKKSAVATPVTERNKPSVNTEHNPKDTLTEKGFSKTTTHQYYNSDLGGTFQGTKKQIDSIVRATERKMALQDSISRKRAADSIKLNRRSKDSIQ